MLKLKITLGVSQFSELPLSQLSKVGTVLKSLEPEDLKTDLTFQIW